MIWVVMFLILKNTKSIFLAGLFIRLCVLMINLANQLLVTEEKNAVKKFITAILNEYDYCKLIVKKYFNKIFLMTVDDEGSCKSSNKGWICGGLFAEGDNKVRDYDHVTCNFRGSTH